MKLHRSFFLRHESHIASLIAFILTDDRDEWEDVAFKDEHDEMLSVAAELRRGSGS